MVFSVCEGSVFETAFDSSEFALVTEATAADGGFDVIQPLRHAHQLAAAAHAMATNTNARAPRLRVGRVLASSFVFIRTSRGYASESGANSRESREPHSEKNS
jgi:hypothetical protein